MNRKFEDYCTRLERGSDFVKKLTRSFCEPLAITTFAYVRIYNDGKMGWLTSNPDQDRLLVESSALNDEPSIDTADALAEGPHLWFSDRQFPGCESFYRDRARLFHMDHGMVLVKHRQQYLETCCFSGLLSKRPLYNLFMREVGLFSAFMDHFKKTMSPYLNSIVEEGLALSDFKLAYGIPKPESSRQKLFEQCGLHLSKRERECLSQLRLGLTYSEIGMQLHLSERTVEHYFLNIKNKLGLETRSQLVSVAHKLHDLGGF